MVTDNGFNKMIPFCTCKNPKHRFTVKTYKRTYFKKKEGKNVTKNYQYIHCLTCEYERRAKNDAYRLTLEYIAESKKRNPLI